MASRTHGDTRLGGDLYGDILTADFDYVSNVLLQTLRTKKSRFGPSNTAEHNDAFRLPAERTTLNIRQHP